MSTTASPAQPPAERRAAEASLRALIARTAPKHARLVAAARRALRKRLPTAQELVYDYRSWCVISFSPTEHGHLGVMAIRASADGVKLYFIGSKRLSDPDRMLRGSGSQARWIPLESATTLSRPAVKSLMEAAIASSTVPFPRNGKGPLVIRTSATTKRPKGRPASKATSKRASPTRRHLRA